MQVTRIERVVCLSAVTAEVQVARMVRVDAMLLFTVDVQVTSKALSMARATVTADVHVTAMVWKCDACVLMDVVDVDVTPMILPTDFRNETVLVAITAMARLKV